MKEGSARPSERRFVVRAGGKRKRDEARLRERARERASGERRRESGRMDGRTDGWTGVRACMRERERQRLGAGEGARWSAGGGPARVRERVGGSLRHGLGGGRRVVQ